MKILLLDLWHDLREKRLAPVAAVLLAGLVAVPVLLAKPATDPGPAPAPASAAKPDREELAALAKVKLGEDEAGRGSTLGVFDPDNPFSPPKSALQKDDEAANTQGQAGASEPSGGGDTGGGDATGGPGGTSGGGDTTTTPDGTTGGTPAPDGKAPTTVYKYVVDITFEVNGRVRRIKGLERLDMLPNDSSPLLIFLGVTPKGSNAVFLVDSTLEAAGEGRCKPSGPECAFAYIGAGAEYVFSAEDGDTYTLKIDEIRKVKVTDDAKRAKGVKGRASVGPHRRFVPPIVADFVVVASDSLQNSNNDSNSR
jgi:hypothetical protein